MTGTNRGCNEAAECRLDNDKDWTHSCIGILVLHVCFCSHLRVHNSSAIKQILCWQSGLNGWLGLRLRLTSRAPLTGRCSSLFTQSQLLGLVLPPPRQILHNSCKAAKHQLAKRRLLHNGAQLAGKCWSHRGTHQGLVRRGSGQRLYVLTRSVMMRIFDILLRSANELRLLNHASLSFHANWRLIATEPISQ